MDEALVFVANKYPDVKIVRIKSTSAVENWPDVNLPTLFLYKDGELQHQCLTLARLYGKSMKPTGKWWISCMYKYLVTFLYIIMIITCRFRMVANK